MSAWARQVRTLGRERKSRLEKFTRIGLIIALYFRLLYT